MTQTRKTVSVNILDKDYQVSCSPDEEALLAISARHLDNSMRNIRSSGKVVGADRIAVMAALNVTNDLLHGPTVTAAADPAQAAKIKKMSQKIDDALSQFGQLES